MQRVINSILLIEDCEADIYLHTRIIKHLNSADEMLVARSGDDAMRILQSRVDEGRPLPDLIFLDINTPGMEAWEFIRQFSKLGQSERRNVVVVMLSGSMNPDDKMRADSLSLINEYRQKPLTREAMREILREHFPRRL